MSTPSVNKGDDGSASPRVRGLGLVHGDVIVTVAHIAKDANIAQLPGETKPVRVRQTAVEGALALMKLSSPPRPQLTVRPLSAGSLSRSRLSATFPRPSVSSPATPAPTSQRRALPSRSMPPRRGRDCERLACRRQRRGGRHRQPGRHQRMGQRVRRRRRTAAAGNLRGCLASSPAAQLGDVTALGPALDIEHSVGPGPAVLLGVLRTGGEGNSTVFSRGSTPGARATPSSATSTHSAATLGPTRGR
jgi:hypothetical protein